MFTNIWTYSHEVNRITHKVKTYLINNYVMQRRIYLTKYLLTSRRLVLELTVMDSCGERGERTVSEIGNYKIISEKSSIYFPRSARRIK